MAEVTQGLGGLKIYGAIAAVMRETSAISKGRKNQQQGFQFRGIDDVMNELHGTLAKCGVFIVPEVLEENRSEKQSARGGTLFYTRQKIRFRFYADDGSFIDAVVIGEAMDSGDKASNKALSIGFKYACLQVFCIPTEDEKDPDAQCHELSAGAQQERRNAMKQQQPARAAAPAAGVQQGLPGGPDTPQQTARINELLSTRTPDGRQLFSKQDTQEMTKLRMTMPANALIAYIQQEVANRMQQISDQQLASDVEAEMAAAEAAAIEANGGAIF